MRRQRRVLTTVLLLALIWALLVDQQLASVVVALPVIAVALWLSLKLAQPQPLPFNLRALLRFLPIFLRESFQGGFLVARQVLAPRLRIEPARIEYTTCLQHPLARVFYMICVNLLPGTLVARQRGALLCIHLLDRAGDPIGEMRRLEDAVAAIFNEPCHRDNDPEPLRG